MIVDVKVPVLAESVPDGTLLEWRKQAGEAIARDEILIELETDKVVLEVPAPEAGVIKEIVKQTGDVVVRDDVIARIDTEGAGTATTASEAEEEPSPKPEREVIPLSPSVRKLVAERGLDAAAIPGTGKDGRLTKGDVLNFLENDQTGPAETTAPALAPVEPPPAAPTHDPAPAIPPAEGRDRRVPMTRIRARIAERLVQSQQTAAILTTFNEVNMQPVMALRRRHQEAFEKRHGVRLGFMAFFAKAAVLALKRFPVVNGSIDGGDIVYHDYYDIGVAVGSPRGLVVPVIRDVDKLSFAGIETKIAEFGAKAKDGSLGVDELTGGTFTLSNGGVFGSLLSTPIINPPQSAILGMHKTQDRPVAENGEVVVRPMMYLALSYDHRLIDGREAVQFLVTIKEALEDPGRMLLEV